MRHVLVVLLLFFGLYLQVTGADRLFFRPQGEFKILQFTDLHLNGIEAATSLPVFEMVNELLDAEKPDLVIFTGDVLGGKEVRKSWEYLADLVAKRQIPWTVVFGNHDQEHKVSREELAEIVASLPYSLMQKTAKGIDGVCNHILPVYNKQTGKAAALVYCFDSNSYPKMKGIGKYDWIKWSQIDWYGQQSARFTKKNDGKPLPAIAFFHIALPEYQEAWNSKKTKRIGDRNEQECPPVVNSGLFTRMLECGDVMGTFVGHDHVNDYAACLHNIALVFGRFSGGTNTYGSNKKTLGGRVIVLKEGKREFDTYIREKGNAERIYPCTYPSSFVVEK